MSRSLSYISDLRALISETPYSYHRKKKKKKARLHWYQIKAGLAKSSPWQVMQRRGDHRLGSMGYEENGEGKRKESQESEPESIWWKERSGAAERDERQSVGRQQ